MLARHAFQLAAAHATRKPPEDHWAFLEEIDAPQWVDFTLEAALEGTEGDDPWFHQTHWHHETPLIHLVDLLPQQASHPGYNSRQIETKKPVKLVTSLPEAPREGSGGNVRKLQKANNGQAWPRSQAKRVQPLCLTSQDEYDIEGPCSSRESAVGKTPGFLLDDGEDDFQERRRFTCTSEQSVNHMDNVGLSVRESQDVLVTEFSLESVGSCASLTQVRRKYLSISGNDELQHFANGDEDMDLQQSASSVCPDGRKLQTRQEDCPRFVPALGHEYSEGPPFGVEQIAVADFSTPASKLVENAEPECSDQCSPATRKPIPDWSSQISIALKQSATSRLQKSWGGALRVRQGDVLGPTSDEGSKENGAMLRDGSMDDDRSRKYLGGPCRLKESNLELSLDEDGKEAGAANKVPADDGRVRQSCGSAIDVRQGEIVRPSIAQGMGTVALNLDEAVDDGRIQKSWKGAMRVKLEDVDSCKGDAGTRTGETHPDVAVHNERIQPHGNLDAEEEGTSCLSELSDICLRHDAPEEIDTSNRSAVTLVKDRARSLENLSDDSMVLDASSAPLEERPAELCKPASAACTSMSLEESASLAEGPSKLRKLASTASETCKERTPSASFNAQPKLVLKAELTVQSGARAKECLKGRPPKANKENLSLETGGGKGQHSALVTNKPRTAFERPKHQQKEVLRMSMPVFQPSEAVRRSAQALGSEGSVRRSVLAGDRTKVRQDFGISRTVQTLNHARPSSRSANGQAGFRRSMSALPTGTTKRPVSGDNKSLKATANSALRTSMSQEKGSDLAALIAEHNRKVRPAPQYEPRLHSLRDIREWERRTGQKYYSLPAAERAKVNQELSALKA